MNEIRKKLIDSYTVCIAEGGPERCRPCEYRGDHCVKHRRDDTIKFLQPVEQETVTFPSTCVIYENGEKETETYWPYFPFKVRKEQYFKARKKYQAVFSKSKIIKGHECCSSDSCRRCPYHEMGCIDLMQLETLAFLMQIRETGEMST